MYITKNIFLIYFFAILCYVRCDLELPEGAACVTDNHNGTCVNIYKCSGAAVAYIYRSTGFKGEDIAEVPDVCSYDERGEPIVCCTECTINETQGSRYFAVGPLGVHVNTNGPKSWQKCYDYFLRLPYPCRGIGNVKVERLWNEDKMCEGESFSVALAVGGRDAQRWEFPHLALLGYGVDEDSAEWNCGGSVISERFILTAAHCSSIARIGSVKYAALGILKRSDPKELWIIHKIKQKFLHPEYKSPNKYNDIALLQTENEINFGKTVLPACLDAGMKSSDLPFAESAGWGRLGNSKPLADTLQVVHLEPFKEEECASHFPSHRYQKAGYNHSTQMCYGSHDNIADTCEADSGGPLQYNDFDCLYHIIGVTSYGRACGYKGSPGMYTRVKHYIPWIESIVWPDDVDY